MKNVGHGDELDRAAGGAHRVAGRPRAAAAATDEGDLDGVGFAGMHLGQYDAGERGGGADLDDIAPGPTGLLAGHGECS